MAGKGYEVQKQTRGEAGANRQLSKLQRHILVWIERKQSTIEMFRRVGKNVGISGKGIPSGRTFNEHLKELNQKGVLWSAKLFYDAAPTKLESKSLSRALLALEARGLIIRYDVTGGIGNKTRTKHVRLTKVGRNTARFLMSSGGRSQRELREQRPPASRLMHRHIHELKGRLKVERAHLKRLEENKGWFEEFRMEATCWDSVVSKEVQAEMAETKLHEVKGNILELEADLEVLEKFCDDPRLDEILNKPNRLLLDLPPRVYRFLCERELDNEHTPPIML